MKILSYLWTGVICIIEIIVVFAIISSSYLGGGAEKILACLIILVYIRVKQFSSGYAYLKERELIALTSELESIKKIVLKSEGEESQIDEETIKQVKKRGVNFWISTTSNSILYLIIILSLLGSL